MTNLNSQGLQIVSQTLNGVRKFCDWEPDGPPESLAKVRILPGALFVDVVGALVATRPDLVRYLARPVTSGMMVVCGGAFLCWRGCSCSAQSGWLRAPMN
jgi:hypothetical protein